MKTQLFSIIILLLISSCSVQQKATRKITWLKSHGYLSTKKDTIRDTIVQFKDTGSTKLVVEHDSIKVWYEKDTCFTKERVKKILSVVKVEPVKVNNDRIQLDIWIDKNGKLQYKYLVKEVIVEKPIEIPIVKDCPKERWWDKWYIGVITSFIAFVLMFFIFGKRE